MYQLQFEGTTTFQARFLLSYITKYVHRKFFF